MYKPLRYDAGKLTTIKDGTASSTTITKFDALAWTGGYLRRAIGTDVEVRLLAMEDVTTAGGAHEDIQVLITNGVEFECDTTGNTAVTMRGTKVDMTDHEYLDEDSAGTDYAFYITEKIGAAADKKVRGYFVQKVS
jgi:hypothetical protein